MNKKGILKPKEIIAFLKHNKWLLLLFCFAVAFFIWQRATDMGWDFPVYVLNAKYWFAGGNFFEWAVSPLTSFLIGILSFLGWKGAEYSYIVLISALHLFSCILLAKKFKINSLIFYALSLSPFLLFVGLSNGTELLSLTLLQFFVVFLGSARAPLFLGLAVLTRYTNFIFAPLLFFTKNWKKIGRDVLIIIVPLLPWFLFNFIATGNAFTSFMDSYALNIKFRGYIHQPFSLLHVLQVTSYLLPLAIAGIIIKIKDKKWKENIFWVMIIIIVLTLISYTRTPIKDPRYLFNLLLPFSFFSAVAITKIKNKLKILKVILISLLLIISFSIAIYGNLKAISYPPSQVSTYSNVLNETKSFQLEKCALVSNSWVSLNYLGITCEKTPRKELLEYKLSQGYRILFFTFIQEPDYARDEKFINKFPVLARNENYILLGNSSLCAPIKKADQTYLESIKEWKQIAYNESFSIDIFELFLTKKAI